MKPSSDQTSKLISYWLRHKPEEGGITVDDFGWTSTDALLKALHTRGFSMSIEELVALNGSFDKVRWEFDEDNGKIRATHGHSFAVVLHDKAKLPPKTLYHGTAVKNVSLIAEQGLLPMRRQFVHLSETIETALAVGSRHGKPILIEIDAERLAGSGSSFFQTSDNVWLTAAIPIEYLSFTPWLNVRNSKGDTLEELKREIGDRRSHFIYPQLGTLQLIWQSTASDDYLFQNTQTGECFLVHLAYTRNKQEVDGWPRIERYQTLEEWLEKGLWLDQQYFYDLK